MAQDGTDGGLGQRDCTFDEDGRWFRYRAAAVILHEGRVLMARNEVEPYFYSIGGGVRHGETAQDAVRREVREETGVDMEVDRLAFIHENFFAGDSTASLRGRECHELAFYFVMRYEPGMALTAAGTTLDGVREWHEWVDLATYGRDRPAHPAFFATELPRLGTSPAWIVSRG
ncbi:NUDIX hydrolase [Propionicimonas sp.]|uniref:NUDIX hydrolase n=1 Tax=Propionicimonas sp. TaxID=1955623 RepID=UPI0039E6EFE4